MVVMTLQKNDGFPFAGLEPAVDALRFLLYVGHQVAVTLNASPAGRSDLDKREPLPVTRALLEEALDAAKALQNSLRVVDAIHTHPQECGFDAEAPEQCGAVG